MRGDVSVVIPFYRSNEYLLETLESIYIQNGIGEVIIVVDKNGGNVELGGFRVNKNLKVVNNLSNFHGPGVCRSIGFNQAKCKYVAFLDSDDVWFPSRVNEHLEKIVKNNMSFSFGIFKHFNSSKKNFKLIKPIGPFNLINFYKKKFTIGCLTVVIDKSQIHCLPPILIKRRNDYLMWEFVIKQCLAKNLNWGGYASGACLAGHRIHENSLTHSKIQSAFSYYKFLKVAGLGLFKRIWFFSIYFKSTVGMR